MLGSAYKVVPEQASSTRQFAPEGNGKAVVGDFHWGELEVTVAGISVYWYPPEAVFPNPALRCNLPVELISKSPILELKPVGVIAVHAAPPLATVERNNPDPAVPR